MKLSRVNTLLLVAVIVTNAGTILLPAWPALQFWWQRNHTAQAATLTRQIHTVAAPQPAAPRTPQPAGDRLVIPSMLLDQPVYEGKDARTLNKGLWLRPQGSTPDKHNNTVIAGHRFTYTNPRGTLYSLDKVHLGDEAALYWHGTKYLYRVTQVAVVAPTATDIEAPTAGSQLTIYTCTPLWNPKNRLVVIATPEDGSP